MKTLIYAATFTLILTSSIPAAQARNLKDFNVTHLGNSVAIPKYVTVHNARHQFKVHVRQKALSELSIKIPEKVSINEGIEVKNQAGQKVPASVSINDGKATLVFSQPVAPETTLSVSMQGVKTPAYKSIWHYSVFAKNVGMTTEIPLGLARIQTYR